MVLLQGFPFPSLPHRKGPNRAKERETCSGGGLIQPQNNKGMGRGQRPIPQGCFCHLPTFLGHFLTLGKEAGIFKTFCGWEARRITSVNHRF